MDGSFEQLPQPDSGALFYKIHLFIYFSLNTIYAYPLKVVLSTSYNYGSTFRGLCEFFTDNINPYYDVSHYSLR